MSLCIQSLKYVILLFLNAALLEQNELTISEPLCCDCVTLSLHKHCENAYLLQTQSHTHYTVVGNTIINTLKFNKN